MEITEWWPKLDSATQEWLVAHNGEAVPRNILERIEKAGGSPTSPGWWMGEEGPDGFSLTDEAIDWIEATANDEQPATPGSKTNRGAS